MYQSKRYQTIFAVIGFNFIFRFLPVRLPSQVLLFMKKDILSILISDLFVRIRASLCKRWISVICCCWCCMWKLVVDLGNFVFGGIVSCRRLPLRLVSATAEQQDAAGRLKATCWNVLVNWTERQTRLVMSMYKMVMRMIGRRKKNMKLAKIGYLISSVPVWNKIKYAKVCLKMIFACFQLNLIWMA